MSDQKTPTAAEMVKRTNNAKNSTRIFDKQYEECMTAINNSADNGEYSTWCFYLTPAQREHFIEHGYDVKYHAHTCFEDKKRYKIEISWDPTPTRCLGGSVINMYVKNKDTIYFLY